MSCPFDLRNKKQVIKFEEVDPYNPENTVKGYVNRRQGQLYGALYITHINGKRRYQLIYSAPKQHYPFDKSIKEEKVFKFPEYDSIELYEKLDGTCIISYRYTDGKDWFYTYKTRLRPFLGTSKYGNFFQLWNEILDKYPIIDKEHRETGDYNYIYELYGKRNKILIDYDIPLDTRLIFIVTPSGNIMSPDSTEGVKVPKLESTLQNIPLIDDKLDKSYLDYQTLLETNLQIDEENQIMKGKEGLVWYFIKDEYAVQIKCKPPSVLKYHWSGDAIAYESIYTTIHNAFENFDEPSYEDIVSLLQEEFTEDKIEKSRARIEKVLGKILFDKKFLARLEIDYKEQGFNINEDKVTCMRWFGKNYPKAAAKRIYQLLKRYEEK